MSRPRETPFDSVALLGVLRLLMSSLAYASELFVRKNGSMGSEYPGPRVVFCGIVVVPMVMILVSPPQYGAEYILWHAAAMFLAACLHDRQRRVNLVRLRVHIHRHYIGNPLIGGRKRWGEFFLGLAIAAALVPVCDTLALWHFLGTISCRIELQMMMAREKRIRDRMRDSQIEAAHYSSNLRDESY